MAVSGWSAKKGRFPFSLQGLAVWANNRSDRKELMKQGFKKASSKFPCQRVREDNAQTAFTVVELLAVIAVMAMLSALLLPALAGAKAGNFRAQCANNLKQLGVGFSAYEQDHNDMFPPAAYQATSSVLAWDSWIHRYIGGTASDMEMMTGILLNADAPQDRTLSHRCSAKHWLGCKWVTAMVSPLPEDRMPCRCRTLWGRDSDKSTPESKIPITAAKLQRGHLLAGQRFAVEWSARLGSEELPDIRCEDIPATRSCWWSSPRVPIWSPMSGPASARDR